MKTVRLLYGKTGMELRVPDSAAVLEGASAPAIADANAAVAAALANPIGARPLRDLLLARRPRTVAITISDITRPVPNKAFLPPILAALNSAGIADAQVCIIIGTGMHRPSTPAEREIMLGAAITRRVEVIDHTADRPETVVRVSDDPPVSVNRRFAQADFRIVTGYIEPHFMAGYSGGRKGVCPALVDLATIQRFHGYKTLSDPRADNGRLDGNPCHDIAVRVARKVGVDFLFNVAITRDRRIAGIYCGDLEQAHLAGCADVAKWTSAAVAGPFDLVVTNGGGYPLDATFYQTVKGMCTALPALGPQTTMLIAAECSEQMGSPGYAELMLAYGHDWRKFLADIAASDATQLDQWELQMHARVLDRIGIERLWFASDGVPMAVQQQIAVTPLPGAAPAPARVQHAIDQYLVANPAARVAVIPDGPYTMLTR
jgi:nickel-dependent lactate racemase